MLYCRLKGVKVGLMSEPYTEDSLGYFSQRPIVTEKAKSVLRPLIYQLAAYLVGKGLFVLFPISDLAAQQFKGHGFRALGIYPFAYFVPRLGSAFKAPFPATELQCMRIVFVGSFIKRKGIGVLLEAWAVAQRVSVGMKSTMELDIYGTGQLDERDLPSNVRLRGPIPFGESQSVIAQYGALILPSLHDGWGVVVNEALLQGVPALVSDRVGAQGLVKASGAGAIFKAGSVTALAELFVRLADDPQQLKDWATGAKKLAHRLEPSAGAEYLLACLEHAERGVGPAPTPPWMRV
jgi:glycosyltransferase involved in cell wall biosynthesis